MKVDSGRANFPLQDGIYGLFIKLPKKAQCEISGTKDDVGQLLQSVKSHQHTFPAGTQNPETIKLFCEPIEAILLMMSLIIA